VHEQVHGGVLTDAHSAEARWGDRTWAEENDHAVEGRGRGNGGEDEPHLTTGYVGCGSHVSPYRVRPIGL
jgi:hypothetical protein